MCIMKNEMLRNLFVEMTKGAECLVNLTIEHRPVPALQEAGGVA